MEKKKSAQPATPSGKAAETIASDIYAIARIEAIPTLLDLLCEITGMGFAAVARVSNTTWTVCGVRDRIDFGLKIGDQLPLESTLCVESRRAGAPIVIDCVSSDPRYQNHRTPKMYKFESYISAPIVLINGHYFGNLCAVDPSPAVVSAPAVINTFTHFASLIAYQLASEEIVERAYQALQVERDARQWRDILVTGLSETLLNPVKAISEASNTIDSKASDSSAVRGLATRIRTNALKISSLVERLLNLSGPEGIAELQPKPEVAPTRTVDDCKSPSRPSSSDQIDRDALESLLMQRVGELRSHLGRFDMYALAIARWLEDKTPGELAPATLTLDTRGAWISSRLQSYPVSGGMLVEFDDINRELLAVLARQEIAARNSASIPALQASGVLLFPQGVRARDWYDHLGASEEEIVSSIDAMDRDIVSIATLYLRLAAFAGRLSLVP